MSKMKIAFSLISLTPFAAFATERDSVTSQKSQKEASVGHWHASEHSVSVNKESSVKHGKGEVKAEGAKVLSLTERKGK